MKPMKCLRFLALTFVLLFAMQGKAEDRSLSASGVFPIHWEIRDYPRLVVNVLALKDGVPYSLEQLQSESLPRMTDGAAACSLLTTTVPARPQEYDLHVFIDLKDISWPEMLTVNDLVGEGMKHKGFQLTPYYHIQDGEGIRTVNVASANKMKLDSLPDPSLSIEAAIDTIRSIEAARMTGGRIYWIIGAELSIAQLKRCDSLFEKSAEYGPSWLVALARKTDFENASKPLARRLLFCGSPETPREELAGQWSSALDVLGASHYSIAFQTPAILGPADRRSFTIAIGEGSYRLTTSIPDTILHRAATGHYRSLARQLVSDMKYAEALDTLRVPVSVVGIDSLRSDADSVLLAGCADLLSSNKPLETLPLFDRAEKDWGRKVEDLSWYKNLKTDLLVASLKSVGDDKPRQLDLAEKLSATDPGDRSRKAFVVGLKGELASASKDYWQAADCFAASHALEKNAAMQKSLQQAVTDAVIADYASENYSRIFEKGATYDQQILASFDLRYMYGVSAMRSHDYGRAAQQFEWCALNWKESTRLTTWNSLFATMQESYAKNLKFDDAYRVNRRLFQQRGEKEMLLLALKDLRARLLSPIIRAFPVFSDGVGGRTAQSSFWSAAVPGGIPHYVDAICYTDANGELLQHLGGKVPHGLPTRELLRTLQGAPALVEPAGAQQVYWLVNRVNDGFVLISFTDKVNEREGVLLSAVRSKKKLDEPWASLVDYEQGIGVRFLADIFGNMLSAEQSIRGSVRLAPYWNVLSGRGPLAYLVLHEKKGEITQNCSFENSKAEYNKQLWQQSSTALAYFKQEIKYDGKPVVDVATPVYAGRSWKATMRFGVARP